jgi:hypothetical protein
MNTLACAGGAIEIRAAAQIRLDRCGEDRRLLFIGREDHHDVGAPHRALDRIVWDAVFVRGVARWGAVAKSHDDVVSAIAQVTRVRAALAAVADDRDRLAAEFLWFGVGVVKGVHRDISLSSLQRRVS